MGVNEFCSIQEMQRQLEEERLQHTFEVLDRLAFVAKSEDIEFLACELGVKWVKS